MSMIRLIIDIEAEDAAEAANEIAKYVEDCGGELAELSNRPDAQPEDYRIKVTVVFPS